MYIIKQRKMKRTIYYILSVVAIMLTSCEDFTDLQPKGKNLLTSTNDLELLLNAEYNGGNSDMRLMAGDVIRETSNVAAELSKPIKSRKVIMYTYDEEAMDKMVELTPSDDDYTFYYGIIGKIANPILQQIDDAAGDEATKKRIKCEALTLRAWSLYMLVNKFAKAYNPTTAIQDPGIILLDENTDIQNPQPQSNVQQVYEQILQDINEAIELDGLPERAVNKMRINKPAAYAIKALTLLNMQKWDEAEDAAKQALAINGAGVINDYNTQYQGTMQGYVTGGTYPVINRGKEGTDEDYFMNGNMELFYSYPPETISYFEDGHIYKEKIAQANMEFDYLMDAGEYMLGVSGFMITDDSKSLWNNGGLRSTQMYLAIAECETHKGNIDTAMEYLDKVREKRIMPDKYQPLKGTVTTESEAIAHVKQVTLNEDLFSVNIFIDKKRWNQLDAWKQVYSRTLLGKTYTIAPDSKMWIFPFPQNVLNNNPLITQNYKAQ